MSKRLVTALAFTALGLLVSVPASAQLDPLTDPLPRTLGESADKRLDRVEQTLREMRAILFQGRDTGRPVVVQPAETQGQVSTLDTHVADVQETLRRINGQLDQMATDITAIRRDAAADAMTIRTLAQANNALVARVDAMEKSLDAINKANAARAAAETARAQDPTVQYTAAMQLFIDGQYAPAATAFQAFLAAHPDDPNAPQARYELAESQYKQASYNEAAQSYLAAIRGWPATVWGPDAVVKLGLSLIELKRNPDACDVLAQLDAHYPMAPAAIKTQARTARTRARCA